MDFDFSWVSTPDAWVALLTLTLLEIVLGIDNIVFISILSGKLPEHQQAKARTLGLGLAMGGRIVLLLAIGWVMGLPEPLFTIPFLDVLGGASGDLATHGTGASVGDLPSQITGRDIILLIGGAFLIGKSTHEIHNKLDGEEAHGHGGKVASFGSVIFQILLLDIVFSLDSVITAVGMADEIMVMIIAVVIAVGVMMLSAGKISTFIEKHPTIKMLALSFLLLIGFTLIAEGLGTHVPKGFIYSAMGFSLFVEALNIKLRTKTKPPVKLRNPRLEESLDAVTEPPRV